MVLAAERSRQHRSGHVQSAARTVAPMTRTAPQSTPARTLLNKAPEVTLFFWIIRVLPTRVGEPSAAFLSGLGLGLSGTRMVMPVAFIGVLVGQSRPRQYVPGV